MDFDSGRKRRCDFCNLGLDSVDHVQGVLAGAHHYDAADGFTFALPLRNAFTNIRPEADGAEVAQQYRRSVLRIDGHFFEIFQGS